MCPLPLRLPGNYGRLIEFRSQEATISFLVSWLLNEKTLAALRELRYRFARATACCCQSNGTLVRFVVWRVL